MSRTKQEIETREQKKAFEFYYELSPRSFTKTAKKIGKSDFTVRSWAKKFHWDERMEKRNSLEKEKTDQLITDKKAEMNARHIEMSKTLQEVQFEEAKNQPYHTGKSATVAWKTAIEVERLAIGEATERLEVNGPDSFNMDDLQKALEEVNEERAALKKNNPLNQKDEIQDAEPS